MGAFIFTTNQKMKIFVNFNVDKINMDTAVKYKMISKIINSNDDSVLSKIKSLLQIDDEVDFWDELSEEDKIAVNDGLKQLDNGQYVSHESLQDEIRKTFNF